MEAGAAPAVFQHSQFFNAASSLQIEANGLPREGNLYQIEGIDDDERTGLLQIIIPPAEAIESVDISTNNFEAEHPVSLAILQQMNAAAAKYGLLTSKPLNNPAQLHYESAVHENHRQF